MTAAEGVRRRGQPLAMLAVLLAGWIVVRALVWEAPGGVREDRGERDTGAQMAAGNVPPYVADDARVESGDAPAGPAPASPALASMAAPPRPPAGIYGASALGREAFPPPRFTPSLTPTTRGQSLPVAAAPTPRVQPLAPETVPPASEPSPTVARLALAPEQSGAMPAPVASTAGSRWSGDSWLLLRRGSGSIGAAPQPSYGASQAGAVLRYALARRSARAPQAFIRLSRALGRSRESEAAAGVALRPVAALPLRLLAEIRAERSQGRTRLSPAASLVTAMPPQPLPLGAQAELYAQAGYVAGELGGEGEGATPFFDAQLAGDAPVLAHGAAELRIGAGAWAGGQQGAARLDLGPRATVRMDLGEASSRLAFDWRIRVAGKAAPGSGPALTFSAGF